MINITEFLVKKHVSNQYSLPAEFNEYIELNGNRIRVKGWLILLKNEPSLLYKVWSTLKINGPMSKEDVLRELKLKETSYTTSFTDWSVHNIIVRKGGKCYPLDVKDWEEKSK